MNNISVLVVDDEEGVHYGFKRTFPAEITVYSALTAAEGLAMIRTHKTDVALLDIKLPDRSGVDLIEEIKRVSPRTSIIIMTAFATGKTTMEAMAKGAFDYITKPFDMNLLLGRIEEAASLARYKRGAVTFSDGDAPARDTAPAEILVGMSKAMSAVYKLIGRLAPSNETVLISGESGTGKELVARAIVQHSHRARAPYLAINCAAFPETLLDAELFGHEKGAFTGAAERRTGKFEACDEGTIRLDEIGEMPIGLQAKRLRVLQEKEITRLGASRPTKLDVRILAATNRDLRAEVAAHRFRQDLYYRLTTAHIQVPPLRERKEDIPALAEHLARRIWLEQKRPSSRTPRIAPRAIKQLTEHHWPGNVRELENVLRQALLVTSGDTISSIRIEPVPTSPDDDLTLALFERYAERHGDGVLAALEADFIRLAMQKTGGNLAAAARLLGLSRNTLRKKVRPSR